MTILRLFLVIFLPTAGVLCLRCFWSRFYIVVLGMTFFFLSNLLFPIFIWTFISLFSLDFYFPFFWGLLFSLWTFISLFSLDFYFPFFWGLLFSLWTFIFSLDFYFPFSHWTFISLFSLDFYFLFGRLFNRGHILDFFQIFYLEKQPCKQKNV